MVVFTAIAFGIMGLIGIFAPATLGGWVGHDALGRDAANEFRAVYGGFGLAMAGVLLATQGSPAGPGVQLTAGVALVGMAGGRVLAALLDGPPSARMWIYAVGETAIGLALVFT